ncbi:hypothetical protein OG218_02060 [Kineococcus sp. NBC_00420]|uniref:hypothetical protein n=1 Tax=Kineococcus sp. NBC_00420 TaxID=2903564 RepID=UPI002E222596
MVVMHMAGVPSWQIKSGFDGPLTLALYVRDAAGLGRYASAQPDLPPLQPSVAVQPVGVDLGEAIRQWERWWPRALAERSDDAAPFGPPRWPGLEDLPVLQALVEQHFEDFTRWSRQVQLAEQARAENGSLGLVHFVNSYEGTLGRPLRPFSLNLREVPVEGSAGWVLEPGVVVVSSALLDDERSLEAFLRPVIDSLA